MLLFLLIALAGSASAQQGQTHVVRPGDTLWDLSRQYKHSPLHWQEIQKDNAVRTPERLKLGQVLLLGGAVAIVSELAGSAWIKRGNTPQRPLARGAGVQPGDVLVTEQDAFLSMTLADGSHVVMPSSSALKVLAINGQLVRFELLNGRLESHVEKQNGKHFEIRTKSAELGVRGTYFRVRDEDNVVAVEVIEGKVAVGEVAADPRNLLLGVARGSLLAGSDAMQSCQLLPAPERLESAIDGDILAAPMAEASGYRLQLARDDRFLQLIHEQISSQPRFILPDTLAPGFFHLRLTALDQRKLEGLPSDSTVYVAASASRRSGVENLGDGRYKVRWPGRSGQKYRFELARTTEFSPLLAEDSAFYGNGVTVGPFAVPGKYYWRSVEIDSNTGDLAAAPSFSGSFEVPAP
ncbi:fecR family protein [Collimonas arenae]|uniref:FecR family protein n=3 Tax=Oxalobacteraceae TaxID=75682 RepID=A0A127QPH6_9BURK|nr:fecR family protein [Collimonas arenae]AMP17213.1 fecR family protein [Collimonas pratensis]